MQNCQTTLTWQAAKPHTLKPQLHGGGEKFLNHWHKNLHYVRVIFFLDAQRHVSWHYVEPRVQTDMEELKCKIKRMDFTHNFWDCPRVGYILESYTNRYIKKTILGIHLDLDPSVCILGIILRQNRRRQYSTWLGSCFWLWKNLLHLFDYNLQVLCNGKIELKKVYIMEKNNI